MPKTSSAGSTQGSSLSTAAMSATGASTAAKGSGTKMTQDAVALLKSDHRTVESLFEKFENASTSSEKSELVKQICSELIIHTLLEEEIFYPACREKADDDDPLDEAQVEHDGAKMLICDLMEASPDDDFYDAKVKVLSEYIKHHVAEEEKPRSGIFSKAKSAGVDFGALGVKLMERKTELKTQAAGNGLQPPTPRAVHVQDQQTQEMGNMARYSNDRDRDDDGRFTSGGRGGGSGGRSSGRDRDEQGRFTSDDDDRNGGSSYRSRSRYDDDDDDYRSRGRGSNDRERDEQGRFMSDDDDRSGRSSRSSGRYDEDDDYRGRSSSSRSSSRYENDDDYRGRSSGGSGRGWYGDSEGHSEASRRGWEDREGGSSRGRGASSGRGSSRYEDDDDYRGRSSSGSGRGHGGWFGDSEGHSEASRRGWEDREGGSNRGRGASSASRSRSSRDDDDDDRGGRSSSGGGRGHGGWFGDSRGHAEAARRGWENR